MNEFLKQMKRETNFTLTENQGITHKSTLSDCLDFFAMGGSMRNRSDEDVVLMFRKAYKENPLIAMRLLFYFRDIRGGQGERRLFRVITKDLEENNPKVLKKNLKYISEFGRWDDLIELAYKGSNVEKEIVSIISNQLKQDIEDMNKGNSISLLAKWMPSLGASSHNTVMKAKYLAKKLKMSPKRYRKTLVKLRRYINIVETKMAKNEWNEIEFDKLPSKAGMKYRKAFERHCGERYSDFMNNKETTVNANTLYPYEIVEKAIGVIDKGWRSSTIDRTRNKVEINTINKYWKNQKDYFNGKSCNLLPVVDTSASMRGTPLNVAISIGLYCAERNKNVFEGHYVSFSRQARLIECEGIDFVDKVKRIYDANLCDNTNIESVFDLLLRIAVNNHMSQDEIPQNIVIISDMEFDSGTGRCSWNYRYDNFDYREETETLMESIAKEWNRHGYEMPHLIYWNVDARQNNIPMIGRGRISYVSGFSPSIFEIILTGKTGYELMLETVNKDRYECITV